MDFSLTEEQAMLRASCERLVRERCTFAARRAQLGADPAQVPALWPEFVALGLAALCVPESAGGLGQAALDGALVAQALGGGWLIEPFVDAALAAPAVLAAAAASPVRDRWLERMAAGEIVVPLRGAYVAGGWLEGSAPHASYAVALLALDDAGRLRLVETAAGERRAYRQFDGTAGATVRVALAGAAVIAEGAAAAAAWQAGKIAARIGRIAEGVGLARAVLDLTADYLRTRRQFGQPIGRFQALAHRMADLLILHEQSQSLAWAAAMRLDPRTVDAAQVLSHRALRHIAQQAIQLHGGIGMTDEYVVSHYAKRMLAIELELGSADEALAGFMAAA